MGQQNLSITTSPAYKSSYRVASASGADWRDVATRLLQQLEADSKGAAKAQGFTTGFLFVGDRLSNDASSLLHLLQDVTGVGVWTGCSGFGVFDHTGVHIDAVSAVVMLANFPTDQIMPLPLQSKPDIVLAPGHKNWLEKHGPPFAFVFADPNLDQNLNSLLTQLMSKTGAFTVGGVSSGRDHQQAQIGTQATQGQLGGLLLGAEVYVQTAMTQGCLPMGNTHVVTSMRENLIKELDNTQAISVFTHDLRQMALERLGQDPDTIMVDADIDPDSMMNQLGDRNRSFFQGEIHIGVNIAGSDRGDYVVRPIMGIDPENDYILTETPLPEGAVIRFVKRDPDTIIADLQRMLDDLRRRRGEAPGAPKAAIYISCVARAPIGGEESPELALLRAELGDIPFIGYYAGGEIFRDQLHCYTGILTLFF